MRFVYSCLDVKCNNFLTFNRNVKQAVENVRQPKHKEANDNYGFYSVIVTYRYLASVFLANLYFRFFVMFVYFRRGLIFYIH